MIPDLKQDQTDGSSFSRLTCKVVMNTSILIVVLLTIVAYSSYRDYLKAFEHAEDQTKSYARALKEHAERTFSETDRALQISMAQLEAKGGINNLSNPEIERILKANSAKLPYISSISVARADGRMIATSFGGEKNLAEVSERSFFKFHRNNLSRDIYIGKPIKSRVITNSWQFTLSRRLEAESGRFNGVIMAAIDKVYFEKLYESVISKQNLRVSLASVAGDYLVFIPYERDVFGEGHKISKIFRKHLESSPEGTYFNKRSNITNDPRIISYNRLDGYPAVAIVSITKAKAIEKWLKDWLFGGIAITIITVLIIILMSRKLSQAEQFESINIVLKQQQEELKAAKDAAESSNAAKSEFLANMSHEIRTPINAVIGLTQLTLETNLTEQQKKYLEMVRSASKSLLEIINNILDHSKMEAHKVELEFTNINVTKMANDVAELFRGIATEKGLELNLEIDSEIPDNLIGDPSRLTQILNNLVGNALKFTPKGSITLKVETVEKTENDIRLRFTVSDTGIGISTNQAKKLFKPFSQGDSSVSRRFGGTGLGLMIAKSLVELMGGEIKFSSEPGKGSVFSFDISFVIRKGAQSSKQRNIQDNMLITDRIKDSHLLLVDDSDVTRFVVSEFLTKGGMRVTSACHGGEAVNLVQKTVFDAILMDIQMPEVDGFQATRLIRKLANGKKVPIIAMTAATTDKDRYQCNESGMDDFIAKPINQVEMVEKIVKWISRNKVLPPWEGESANQG